MSDFATSNTAQVNVAQARVSAAQAVPGQVTQIVTSEPQESRIADIKVDLREALSVVIETEEELEAAKGLSHDEVSELEQRRLDLVMWLLNLESRLSPYCADFA